MKRTLLLSALLIASASSITPLAAADDFNSQTIIALERSALDRWVKGDPQGFLENYAPDISYFAPSEEHRVDGLDAMKRLLAPVTGKIRIDRYDLVDPKVQRRGNVAILSYQVVNHITRPGGQSVTVRWNSTAVYERAAGRWRVIHSHFSYTRPELKQQNPE